MYGSKLLTVISEKLSVHVSVSCTISLDLKIFLNSSVCSLFVLREINLGNLKVNSEATPSPEFSIDQCLYLFHDAVIYSHHVS